MGLPDLLRDEKLTIKRPYVWFNPVVRLVGNTYRVHCRISPAIPGYPARVPYPYEGSPVYVGNLDGDLIVDPRIATKKEKDQNSSVHNRATLEEQGRTIESIVQWAGDKRLIPFFSPPGQRTKAGGSSGGRREPIYFPILIIYADELAPIYGYREEKPLVYDAELYPRCSLEYVPKVAGRLPRKFKLLAHIYEGLQVDGCPLPEGMKTDFYWYLNSQGDPCLEDGSEIIIEAQENIYPILSMVMRAF